MKKFEGIVSEIPVVMHTPHLKAVPTPKKAKVAKVKPQPFKYEPTVYASNAIYVPRLPQEPKPSRKPTKLAIALLAFFVLIAIASGVIWYNSTQLEEGDDYEMVTVYVEPGDTLWELVKETNPNQDYDIREYVYITNNDERNKEAFTSTINGRVLKSGAVIYVPKTIKH